MKYKASLAVPVTASGTQIAGSQAVGFRAWQPSTWPPAPASVDDKFITTLRRIFQESILDEIGNVITDAEKVNGDLQHRGHVVAISLMCALEAISAYGYGGKKGKRHSKGKKGDHIAQFVRKHFPREYRPFADRFYDLYRNTLVHNWNLFEATILPGDEPINEVNGTLVFGLQHLFGALKFAVADFLAALEHDRVLRWMVLDVYRRLRQRAKP